MGSHFSSIKFWLQFMFRTLPTSSRILPAVLIGLVLTLLSLVVHLASAMADDQTWFRHPLIRRQSAPRITSFSPQSGPPGTTVTIRGSNFVGVTAVRFNGVAAQSFQIDSASQITAVVSQTATTGLITVLSPLGTGTSSDNFTVQSNTPTITSFTPTTGPPGTQVTITGTNLTGATEVSFNTTSVGTNFTVVSATQINTTVPVGATGGPIKVKTPSGEATSPQSFIVTSGAPPTISSFSPAMGPVGTLVTIEGNNFVGTTSVRFNATESLEYSVVSFTRLTAKVPAGATSGPITVRTPDGAVTSTASFQVDTSLRPLINSFSPGRGPVGTFVIIKGVNFVDITSVKFGDVPVNSFKVVSSTELTTGVPAGAKDAQIVIENRAGVASSSKQFKIRTPDPTRCKVKVPEERWKGEYYPNRNLDGKALAVRDDTNEEGFIKLAWAGSPAGVCGIPEDGFSVRWTRKVTFPERAVYRFRTKADDGVRLYIDSIRILNRWEDQGPTEFTVDWDLTAGEHTLTMEHYDRAGGAVAEFSWTPAPPEISDFSPKSGQVGDEVKIQGKNFAGELDVRFNGKPTQILRGSTTEIVVAVPIAATSGPITVINPGGSAVTSQEFTVSGCNAIESIQRGQTIAGSLETSDCRSFIRGRNYFADRYQFKGKTGDLIAIQVDTPNVNTYVYLLRTDGTIVTENDDAGGTLGSRIPAGPGFFKLPADGTYYIEVTTLSEKRTGEYVITLTAGSENARDAE